MDKIRIVKRKIKGFFFKDDLIAIRQVVHDTHTVISNASILVRNYILWSYHNKHTIPDINNDIFSLACRIVQGVKTSGIRNTEKRDKERLERIKEKERTEKIKQEKNGIKNRKKEIKENNDAEFFQKINEKKKTKQTMFDDMVKLNERLCSSVKKENHYCKTKYSISHILGYSINNLITAYINNITMHFCKYPKRIIKCDLIAKGFKSKEAGTEAGRIVSYFMFDEKNITDEEESLYENLFPAKIDPKNPRYFEIKENYKTYLYKMIEMNCMLEEEFPDVNKKHKKLLNPLPFHSSFVPMHIRIDTSALCQLLMSKKRIDDFKLYYSIQHHQNKPLNITTKQNLLSSFEKIHGRKASSKEEEGTYATELWSFLTNLDKCKRKQELYTEIKRTKDEDHIQWVFDNAVVTDGTSISFQLIDKNKFGRKAFETEKPEDPETSSKENKDTKPLDFSKYKIIGCDPGKKDILCLTDGYRTLKYTRGGSALREPKLRNKDNKIHY